MGESNEYIVITYAEDMIITDVINCSPINYTTTILLNNGEIVNLF